LFPGLAEGAFWHTRNADGFCGRCTQGQGCRVDAQQSFLGPFELASVERPCAGRPGEVMVPGGCEALRKVPLVIGVLGKKGAIEPRNFEIRASRHGNLLNDMYPLGLSAGRSGPAVPVAAGGGPPGRR
jgi:hypothetical protein